MDVFQKKHILMRGWLLGRGYYLASTAMDFAGGFHKHTRKAGVTPEFAHQIQIAHYTRTLSASLMDPERVLAAAFLHDVCEDYDVGFEEIEERFGKAIRQPVQLLTKKYRGTQVPPEVYFGRMAEDPVASVVKGIDRTHNVQTMVDVFSLEKQKAYLDEMETYFLPMLKTSRRLFPSQEPAYENIKHMLSSQAELIRAIHSARD